jgi:hypothetical protein
MRDTGRAYEYKVLSIGSPHFFHGERPRGNTLLVWVLRMPDRESVEENDICISKLSNSTYGTYATYDFHHK